MTPRLGRPFGLTRLAPAAHGVFHQTSPELLEISRREALAAERVGPLAGEILDEAVPFSRETTRLPDEIGQSRRHRLLLHQLTHGVEQVRFEPPRRGALVDG